MKFENINKNNNSIIKYSKTDNVITDICSIIESARDYAFQSVNLALVERNWLIGYRIAEEELKGGKTHFLRPRLVGYFAVMLIMITAFSYVLLTRTPFKLEVERGRGTLYQLSVNDTITNGYNLKLINMSQSPQSYTLAVEGLDGLTMDAETTYYLNVNELREVLITLEIDPAKVKLTNSRNEIKFVVRDGETGEVIKEAKNAFIAPLN